MQEQTKWPNFPFLRQPLVGTAYCNSPWPHCSSHHFRNILEEAEEHNPPCIAKPSNSSPGKADDRDTLGDSGITGYSAELKHFIYFFFFFCSGGTLVQALTLPPPQKMLQDCRSSAGKLPLAPTSPSSKSQTKLNRMGWIIWP